MVKKLGIFALLMVLVGCSNVENQLKDTDNAVFSLDEIKYWKSVCSLS